MAVIEQKLSFRLKHIVKKYGISYALDDVSLEVMEGEVIGLIGANGAGKSTLMSILTGVNQATEGSIEIGRKKYKKDEYNATEARENHIACCYQELSVCDNLRVYENFAVTIMDHKPFGKMGWRKQLANESKKILDEVFPDNKIDVYRKVETLSIEQKQMVEICCTLATSNCKILIFDEPTSSLSNERIKQFHEAINKWRDKGLTIIYISHKLEEIIRISTRIVVMRNGKMTGELVTSSVNVDDLIDIMGGKKADSTSTSRRNESDIEEQQILNINNYMDAHLHNVSMHINKGEVIGISGLGGSGQRELLNVIFNEFQKKRTLEGFNTFGKASFVSGDRQHEGIFKLWNIADNLVISSLDLITDFKLISKKKQDELASQWYNKLKFRARGIDDNITNLSGGNQQKAIIGRGIASNADLIIFDDPTRGVDAGTKKDIYDIIHEITRSGKSVIWYSTEDREMLECDRVYVMREGTIVDELIGSQITEEAIVASSFKEPEIQIKRKENNKNQNKFVTFLTSGSGISIIVFAVIWIILSLLNKNVNSRVGISMMIGSALPMVFIALAQMFIMSVSDINLGIGNAMGLMSVISATYLVTSFGTGLLATIIFIAAYIGTAILIHYRNMPSIVVSLGMSSVWLGIALLIQNTPGGSCPEWLSKLYSIKTPLFPIQVYICIITAIIAYFLIYKWKFGMIIRGAGDNPESIKKHGWSYLGARVTAYLLSAIFVILAGLALTYQGRGSDATSAGSYQMQSIATTLLGGCAFAGGIVEPIGVVCGGLSISLISSMLTLMQIHSDYRTGIIGVMLIIVLFYREMMNRRQKTI